ncbi:protein spaetzle-like [Bactrocera dorsalis]|uniref:Protein spaetzle-like n=1 Tax=Bactrocera dorsalis TaxID=27457 RepID=A0ABM3JPL6_BACDO|nr:protein spaetzle-like [Bactrocera dorsalis]
MSVVNTEVTVKHIAKNSALRTENSRILNIKLNLRKFKMTSKLRSLLKILTYFLIVLQTNARPAPSAEASKDIMKKLQSIFKIDEGLMVYNTGVLREEFENDEIVCAERRAGKSYCKEVENYIEATRLDKIDPKEFEKFRAYFTDDMAMPLNIATRVDIEVLNKLCNTITNLIYPEGAMSEDAKWLLVVQHAQHKQGVLVEECENEERPDEDNSTLPLEDIPKCKQNFIYRKLVVLKDGVMKEEMVKLPSTCECIMSSM